MKKDFDKIIKYVNSFNMAINVLSHEHIRSEFNALKRNNFTPLESFSKLSQGVVKIVVIKNLSKMILRLEDLYQEEQNHEVLILKEEIKTNMKNKLEELSLRDCKTIMLNTQEEIIDKCHLKDFELEFYSNANNQFEQDNYTDEYLDIEHKVKNFKDILQDVTIIELMLEWHNIVQKNFDLSDMFGYELFEKYKNHILLSVINCFKEKIFELNEHNKGLLIQRISGVEALIKNGNYLVENLKLMALGYDMKD